MSAVIGHGAVFQLAAKGGVKLLVGLPVMFHQVQQLIFDLLLQVICNEGQLPVVLEHLSADVERQILGIHNAPDEPEVIR